MSNYKIGSTRISDLLPRGLMFAPVPTTRLRAFVLLLAIALVYPYLTSFALWSGLLQPSGTWINIRIAINIVFEAVVLFILANILTRQNRSWQSIGLSFSWESVLHSVGLFILGYLGYYLVYAIAWYLSAGITGQPVAVQANNMTFLREGNIFLLLIYALINPWFEELIVRAYTMTELAAFKFPEGAVIGISVLLQTGYHIYQGVPSAILNSSLFFIFALYYAATGRALPIVLAHLYFDVLGLLAYR